MVPARAARRYPAPWFPWVTLGAAGTLAIAFVALSLSVTGVGVEVPEGVVASAVGAAAGGEQAAASEPPDTLPADGPLSRHVGRTVYLAEAGVLHPLSSEALWVSAGPRRVLVHLGADARSGLPRPTSGAVLEVEAVVERAPPTPVSLGVGSAGDAELLAAEGAYLAATQVTVLPDGGSR